MTAVQTADRADMVTFTPPPKRRSTLLTNSIIVFGVALLLFGLTFNLGDFNNFLLAEVVAYLCATAGLTVLIGLNGQLSLGHGALMAVGGYTVALMQPTMADKDSFFGWRLLISLAVGVAVTIVAGVIVGIAAARLRGPYLAGVTLSLVLVIEAVVTIFKSVFNSDQGPYFSVDGVPSRILATPSQWQAWIAIAAAIPVLLLLANVVRSRVGRNFRAVRDDEVAAQLAGINVARTQILAFVVSAACAGLSGGVLAALFQQATPGFFSLQLSLNLLLATVIGGLGSLAGAAWGAVVLVFLPQLTMSLAEKVTDNPNSFQRFNGNLPLLIFGLALIVVMIVAPGGVQGLLNRIGRFALSRWRSPRAAEAAGDATRNAPQ